MLRFFRRRSDDPEDQSIGSILLRLGFITRPQLHSALATKLKADAATLLGEILVAQGAVTRGQLERALAQQFAVRGKLPDYAARTRDMLAGLHAQAETIQAHLDAVTAAAEEVAGDAPRLIHLVEVKQGR